MAKNNINIRADKDDRGKREKSNGRLRRDTRNEKGYYRPIFSTGIRRKKINSRQVPSNKCSNSDPNGPTTKLQRMFRKTKSETLDRFKFLSRKKEGESLKQFWNELNGLALKCNFGTITESLVKDVFIVNMINKEVLQKLCTEPKANVNNIQFAIVMKRELSDNNRSTAWRNPK